MDGLSDGWTDRKMAWMDEWSSELLSCLQITAKKDWLWMDLACAHFVNDTGSGFGLCALAL